MKRIQERCRKTLIGYIMARILPQIHVSIFFILLIPACLSKHAKGTAEENRATSVVNVTFTGVQQPIIQGQSSLIFYGWLGPTLGSKLPECAGDCDGDNDCENGLQCFGNADEKERNAEKVPGCSGFRYVNSDGIKSDYCYNPSKAVANRAGIPENSDTLLFVGRDTGFVLGRCQGDCRVNRDCRGELQCYEDEGDTVPGCEGKREKGIDYCFDPNWKDELKKNTAGEESTSIEEEKPLDIANVSIEEQGSSNDGFIPEMPEPTSDPTVKKTPDPTLNPTEEPTMKPTKAPSRRPSPAPITDEPTLSPTPPEEPDGDSTTREEQMTPMPTVGGGKPTLSPTLATEAPTTDSPTLVSPTSFDQESSPVSTTTVELAPFTLILDFYTPKRHLRGLIIQENVDEDEDLLEIVSGLISLRLFEEYPDTYLALKMDAEFMDEVEIDSVTSAAYSFRGEATFKNIDGSDIPSTQEMIVLSQEALHEKDLLKKLRESDDIILELTAGTTVLINADTNSESLSPKNEDAPTKEAEVEERTEQPPGDSTSGSSNNSLRMTAIVLCSVLGATAIGLLGGYFYVRRKEKRERQMYMYELESSDSRGELQEAAPKRSIMHPFSSPIKQKGTFDTQESHSPSPQQQQHFLHDFEDAEHPDLSLPDLDGGYSIGIESCDFSYTRADHNRTISDMSNVSQAVSSRRFEEVNFPSSTSIAGDSIAEDTQASSTIAAATVMTGTLTTVAPLQMKQQGQSDGSVNGSDPSENRDHDDISSSDDDLCELGNVHLSSVLDINDVATVASRDDNFDQVWRRTKGEDSGGSDNTDSIIDLKMDDSPSDDDDEEGWHEARNRKFSFDGEE